MANFIPDRAKFLDLARRGRLCFVYRECLADADTPVSVFAKLGRGPYSFLLESVVGGEKWAAHCHSHLGHGRRHHPRPGRGGHRGRDSQPEAEHEECVNKARAVVRAVELVRQSLRNFIAMKVAA
jgi:anthranilate/para-aminobenzoate synthase component I